jgi:hypothetical protein
LLIGANSVNVVPRVGSFGFVLNEKLAATDHFRKVCSLRLHSAHIPFKVRRRLVLSLILPPANYGIILFTGADSAS